MTIFTPYNNRRAQVVPGTRPKRPPSRRSEDSHTRQAQSMLLNADPSLAEVPGFTRQQLDGLARSVELRRQQLEQDIQHYIRVKQDELRQHEQELVNQYRSMECDQQSVSAQGSRTTNAEHIVTSSDPRDSEPDPDPDPEERTRQKKHTKVHKREKELYGLVTPVFLPLLDARDTSPEKKKKKLSRPELAHRAYSAPSIAEAGASRDAEYVQEDRPPRKDPKAIDDGTELGEVVKDKLPPDAAVARKSKRSTMKKSALRHKDTPRSRSARKRVSLVIDGHTVLPADTVDEPPLTSPSSEATSASNSTASLDDLIDPRLITPETPVYLEHRDAVHHSLPLPMANAIRSATEALSEAQPPLSVAADHSPPSPRSLSIPFGAAQTATHTFFDPPPMSRHAHPIPETAGPEPIYPTPSATSAEFGSEELAEEDPNFNTYVGGLHGSGVDDVNQVGSYGYPSSLGASYMESYMQNRPLSVRMQAATKAGLGDVEKRILLEEKEEEDEEEEERGVEEEDEEEDFVTHTHVERGRTQEKDKDDDNFMGDMDDF
ncbi:Endo-polygalacturonase D [Pyrenophora seminiperda CCB06]|uniref:Endo-polygalacturonase D n=1 Tax=Pyrenophora seminiperda CCB06 TaxID=1302712 RepID=A0A3M7M0E5_9PLEO|nr:Endo-polygalacturonase D [Pyrenophora seminiperda CCB06]